ncbi:MAG: metal-dependent transcriptional regulator, partial [Anaerolineae bacterium]|nr:metal-dependent transcriptional regulator [Anaerolineae bacterium]
STIYPSTDLSLEVRMHESVEDYLNAIYRLRAGEKIPLPLSRLQKFFAFSRVSVHEMIKKLDDRGLVNYQPYQGVCLTAPGEEIAQAVLRRHRLWERFLTDLLEVPWADAHKFAECLEHAVPEAVTERLAELLNNPLNCSLATAELTQGNGGCCQQLVTLDAGTNCRISQIEPESLTILQRLQELQLNPTSHLQVIRHEEESTTVLVKGNSIIIPADIATTIWVVVTNTSEGGTT